MNYENAWNIAKKLFPTWPGFNRLNLSAAERLQIKGCLQNAENWLSALAEASDRKIQLRKSDSGITEWTSSIDLKSDGPKDDIQP